MNKRTAEFNAEFAKVKPQIYERDGFRCQYPADDHWGPLDVDHIVLRSLGGSNDKINLISLCRKHHSICEDMSTGDKIKLLYNILKKKYGYEYTDRRSKFLGIT